MEGLTQQKFIEPALAEPIDYAVSSHRKKALSIEKSFDIQIMNMLGSKTKFEALIRLMEN